MLNTFKKKNIALFLAKILYVVPLASASGLVHAYLPVFPLDPDNPRATHVGAGRFGEGRKKNDKYPRGFGTYGHQGVDIGAGFGTPLYAVADSLVVKTGDTGTGGGIGTVLKPLNGPDIVVVYWHQEKLAPKVKQQTVKAKDLIGYAGNTSSSQIPAKRSDMGPHLHIGIGVRNPAEAVNLWINNVPGKGGEYYRTGLGGSTGGASHTRRFNGKSYLWTNPAPYLSRDVVMETSLKGNDPLLKYLGNTIRTQYNALTGANLPLDSRAKVGQYAHLIPKLKIAANGVPNEFATESKQAAVVGALEGGEADEILGQDSITPEVLAYYAKPRTIFTGNESEVKIDVGDGDITQAELINKLGNSRFGNVEWQQELIGTSMRGMLTEYLNIINAKNFIKKETIKQKERIESLYAAWTSSVTKMNHSAAVQQAFEKVISPVEIPELSVLPVEELFEMIDQGMDVSRYDFSKAVSLTEGQYKGCDPGFMRNLSNMNPGKLKEYLALALRLGFHPNDLATASAVETSFNHNPSYLYPKTIITQTKNGPKASHPAGGYIQLTPGGAGDIPYNTLAALYPAAKPVFDQYLGKNYTAGSQKTAHGPYLQALGNINPRLEFAVYDAYFYAKNRGFFSLDPSKKNLALLYQMIFGSGYSKYSKYPSLRAGYAANSQYDLDGNGTIEPNESIRHPMFRKANCPYFSDEDILTNKYGLTNDDLKLIPYTPAIQRLRSPTLDNLGGHFGFIQAMKEKLKQSEQNGD